MDPKMELTCPVQNYAWGSRGSSSEVSRLKSSADAEFSIEPDKPYAELWMGTHPSGPATITMSGKLLKSFLSNNHSHVGKVPGGYANDDLPFLFKVLSVGTALSIQAHPDKELAKLLHEKSPENYRDSNHKPEMAIALGRFEALSGFRSLPETLKLLEEYAEVKPMVDGKVLEELGQMDENIFASEEFQRSMVRRLFCSFMHCDDAQVGPILAALVHRLSSKPAEGRTSLDELILRLHVDYPGDRGVVVPLLLNYIVLSPGEAFFMGPNEPHAYLLGDCIECMALSDNVVRAGLTPKFKDVETLCSMLHYRCGVPSLVYPETVDECTVSYRPPSDICAEFEVEATVLPVRSYPTVYALPVVDAGSIILVFRGESGVAYSRGNRSDMTALRKGMVLFQAAGEKLTIHVASNGEEVVLYRAHVNLGCE